MEKTFFFFFSVHWADLIEEMKKVCHIHFRARMFLNFLAVHTKLCSIFGGLLAASPFSWCGKNMLMLMMMMMIMMMQ